MVYKRLLWWFGALVIILWAGHLGQAQSAADHPAKEKTCPDLWPVARGEKCGYIDKTGRLIIPFLLNDAEDFSEGLAAVRGKNNKYGFINKTGTFVIQPQFERVGDFSEGLAPVQQLDEHWPDNLAYINPKGEIVIQSVSSFPNSPMRVEFDLHTYRFCGGVARVGLGDERDPDACG